MRVVAGQCRGLRPLGQIDLSIRIQPGLVMQIEVRLVRRQLIGAGQAGDGIFDDGLGQRTGFRHQPSQGFR